MRSCRVYQFRHTSTERSQTLICPKAKTGRHTRHRAASQNLGRVIQRGCTKPAHVGAGICERGVRARVFLLYALFGVTLTLSADSRQGRDINRTRMIRDSSLATGRTCIACGRDALAKVGGYAVCARHQATVLAPGPEQQWKKNVRSRHKRIPMRACQWCGGLNHLTRHHDWMTGTRGQPPRPLILCRRCHAIAEGWINRPTR